MTSPTDAPESTAGFTLIEMAVVLVIIGLMLGLVLTHGPMRSRTVEAHAAAEQVVRGLRLARARAIELNRPVVFSLDVEGHDFRIDGAAPQPLPEALRLAIIGIRREDAGVISFAPDGSSSGGRIEMDGNGSRLLVGVDWLTGRVSIADAT
jgi:general secretion pathway protein H